MMPRRVAPGALRALLRKAQEAAGLVVALTIVCAASSGASTAELDANHIFERAQQYWMAQRYPKATDYLIHVRTIRSGRAQERHYRARWMSLSNAVSVDAVSIEERTHPYVPPPGFDVAFFGLHLGHVGGPNEGQGTNGDLIGVPDLSPTYRFGVLPYAAPAPPSAADMVEEIRAHYGDPADQKVRELTSKQGTETIASAYASNYIIVLLGEEQYEGHPDYHLALTPLRDPAQHRLREMWVDAGTFATDVVRVSGNFVDPGTSSVPWTIVFTSVGGARYIARETSEKPISHWYDSITIEFQHIAPADGAFNGANASRATLIREP
ncbi:MAG TPA: hypothetical protein VFH72_04600 [Candidatus Baltobacteraceae bacterium]|nr:hypothetical protein [Candidatus Baltobacteraceae bacterium]